MLKGTTYCAARDEGEFAVPLHGIYVEPEGAHLILRIYPSSDGRAYDCSFMVTPEQCVKIGQELIKYGIAHAAPYPVE